MNNHVVHIVSLDKFSMSFIEFVENNLVNYNNKYLYISKQRPDIKIKNLVHFDSKFKLISLLYILYKADKIVIHGLHNKYIILILFFHPWLMKKVYWIMRGADFYFPSRHNFIKKTVIKNIGNYLTFLKGDFEYIKRWYGAKGRYIESFVYPSNLFKDLSYLPKEKSRGGVINILIGNSGAVTNNHHEILNKLKKYKEHNIKIYAPFSYGGLKHPGYKKKVIAYGKELFRDKFIPLTEFMTLENYLELLSGIDIAIFAHNRQQAMGNTITLLGFGKKVYMRSDTTTWKLFKDIDVKVYDMENIDINLIEDDIQNKNQEKVKEYFSEDKYIKQLKNLFDSK